MKQRSIVMVALGTAATVAMGPLSRGHPAPAAGGAVGAGAGIHANASQGMGGMQATEHANTDAAVSANAKTGASDHDQGMARGETGAARVGSDMVTSQSINQASFASRDQVAEEVREQITTDNKAMAEARSDAAHLSGDAKTDFKSAAAGVDAARKRLREDLKDASKANASDWTSVRASLAADFTAYQTAVANANKLAEKGTK